MTDAWANFFVAEVSATGALAGLVIVAISINLKSILLSPQLPGRAAETFIVLVGALILSGICLIPQPPTPRAVEILLVGLPMWIVPAALQLRSYNASDPVRWTASRVMLTQMATVPMVAAGVLLFFGNSAGFYCLAAGILAAIVAAVLNTWVLLVEILR